MTKCTSKINLNGLTQEGHYCGKQRTNSPKMLLPTITQNLSVCNYFTTSFKKFKSRLMNNNVLAVQGRAFVSLHTWYLNTILEKFCCLDFLEWKITMENNLIYTKTRIHRDVVKSLRENGYYHLETGKDSRRRAWTESLACQSRSALTSAGILRSVIIMIDDVDHVENLLCQTVRSPSELARF